MSFAADAPNPEEFMIWRALTGVQDGRFVDIRSGAVHALPVIRLLREQGWRGTQIEAVQAHAPQAGIPDAQPKVWTYTVLDEDVACFPSARTLSAILERQATTDLQFLSVDASGLGRQALADIDLTRWRPWILVVRDPDGHASKDDASVWTKALEDAQYIPAYQSRTNYFYIAMEQERLVKYFTGHEGIEGDFMNGTRSGLSSDAGSLARNASSQGLAPEHRSSKDTSGDISQERGAELELRIARIEIAQTLARVETAEAWARSAANCVEAAEARARSAESRANAAASWANRGDVRLREMSRQMAQARVAEAKLRAQAVAEREVEIGRLHHHISAMNGRVQALEDRNRALEERMTAIVNSTSWRVAAPLRAAPGPLRILARRLIRLPYRFIRRVYRRKVTPSYRAGMEAAAPLQQPAARDEAAAAPLVTMAPVFQPRRVRAYADMFKAINKEKVVEQI